MPNIGATELIIIAVVIVVLFGATKLPTFARSVGRSLRIFKSEAKGLQADDEEPTEEKAADDRKAPQEPQELPEAKRSATQDVTERHQTGS